nr:retrovirus-related Pol polyprotein from transposon TNT 1-94 [Tanacetum cinerariifolium]
MIISLKWIFKVKLDEYGDVVKSKARLVAKGYRPEEVINFEESFSPITRIEAIRIFLAYATHKNMVVFQIEKVYASQPEGFVNQDHLNHVFRLKKALYRLTQAPLACPKGIFINLSKDAIEMLKKYGLDQCDAIDILMVGQSKLDEDPNRTLVDPTRYQGMVAKIQGKLTDYGFNFNKIPLYSDSKSVIALSCNTVQHSRMKHIAVHYHFIKEQVENEVVELYFVKTDYQLADIFTKELAR